MKSLLIPFLSQNQFGKNLFLTICCCLSLHLLNGQGFDSQYCPTESATFTGLANSTLCDDYGDLNCEFVIDASNASSSQIGSNLTGLVVCIETNFTINNNFTFDDCTVKISPGVIINVMNSFTFKIKDSKLFACEEMWDGIKLNFGSRVETSNSNIEDADKAIQSSTASRLYITGTTFNRNRVGIFLERNWLFRPKIIQFFNNKFTCDAPLNGTANEITFAGLHLIRVPLYAKSILGISQFRDLQYGIYSEKYNTISFRNFFLINIRESGVFLEKGNLIVRNSFFNQFHKKGIEAYDINRLDVMHATFNYENGGISAPGPDGIGIYGENFLVNSKVNINDCNFNITGSEAAFQNSFGIYMKASTSIGQNTKVLVFDSDFRIDADTGDAIRIEGDYTGAEEIRVELNRFNDCRDARSLIHLNDGDKENATIVHNTIDGNNTTVNPFVFPTYGINLEGSSGANNEVSNNNFLVDYSIIPSIANCSRGIRANFFQNTRYCENSLADVPVGMNFQDVNLGTQLLSNQFIGGSKMLQLDGIIGQQGAIGGDHNGNTWLRKIAFVTASAHAECLSGNCDLSQIFVHTEQMTTSSTTPVHHPENIDPPADWFIVDFNGAPVNNCINQLVDPGSNQLYTTIATGGLNEAIGSTWEAERYLFDLLENETSVISQDEAFGNFHTNNINSSIGKFRNIQNSLKSIFNQPGRLLDKQSNDDEWFSVHDALDVIEEQIDTYGLTPGLADQKEELLDKLVDTDDAVSEIIAFYNAEIASSTDALLIENGGIAVTKPLWIGNP